LFVNNEVNSTVTQNPTDAAASAETPESAPRAHATASYYLHAILDNVLPLLLILGVWIEDGFGRDSSITAIDNVTLEVMDGEFVTLIGPSGCGKSTLLMILAGLYEKTSGPDVPSRGGFGRFLPLFRGGQFRMKGQESILILYHDVLEPIFIIPGWIIRTVMPSEIPAPAFRSEQSSGRNDFG
jgi:hypothetical protein